MKTYTAKRQSDTPLGALLDDSHFDIVFSNENVTVLNENSETLAILLHAVLDAQRARVSYDILRKLRFPPTNRGLSTGKHLMTTRAIRKDGSLSNTTRLNDTIEEVKTASSSIIGYYDRYQRFPFCRATAFNFSKAEEFRKIWPYVLCVDEQFRKHAAQRYAVQRKLADATSQDFVISNTAFTTITVNKNYRTASHRDSGDLKDGFGVMSCIRRGLYSGAYLVMPDFRIAFDMQDNDLLLFDVHETHGNTAISGRKKMFERMTMVFYYREKMIQCGTKEEEEAIAKRRMPGQKLY